jgi:hypothetical protein
MGVLQTPSFPASIFSLVSDQTAAAAVTSFSFPSLDLETDGNYILKAALVSKDAGGQNLKIALNNDTTDGNYLYQTLQVQLAGVVGAPAAGTNNRLIGAMGDRSAGMIYALANIELRLKKIAGYYPIVQSEMASFRPLGGTPSVDIYTANVLWKNTANVTRLDIIADAAGFDIGSRMTLYKVL